MQGIEQVKSRLQWIKDNSTQKFSVTPVAAFANEDFGFDSHITEAIDENGNHNRVKFFGYATFRGDKICRYEGVVCDLDKGQTMPFVNRLSEEGSM